MSEMISNKTVSERAAGIDPDNVRHILTTPVSPIGRRVRLTVRSTLNNREFGIRSRANIVS